MLERIRTEGNRNPVHCLVVVRADGSREHIRLSTRADARYTPPGTALLLVSWRGRIRYVDHDRRTAGSATATAGSAAAGSPTGSPAGSSTGEAPTGEGPRPTSLLTDHDPHTAHRTPLAWPLGLLPAGAALAWGGIWYARLSSYSRRRSPWQVWMPVGGLMALAAFAVPCALLFDGVRESLRWTGIAAAVVTAVAAVCCLRAARNSDQIEVVPCADEKVRIFPGHLLGDTGGPAGTRRHTHIVAGPGVLEFTNDPSGRLRGTPLPPGLVLERVRHQYATDPGHEVRGAEREVYHVAQCRDGEEEVLIAVERRHMPWLVGALTP
ncbi:hypothetical protein [Streptomyces sp. NBC_01264]|uniref:hypothetical protein n=1 Tax=Streptomyces sp. NBC_01264 TaxID=2903804 RepID=UPI002250F5B3|nr:hypothetical protein [Streptomyces sp. NBC_01264]MCX4780284.1 hypothetical protein [Streptomyces sp. NBC_01264]